MALADEKCAACSKTTSPLTAEEISKLACQVPRWTSYGDKIERSFKFRDFKESMDFANKVAEIAEEENHHPDLHISWGKVRVELSTHSIGGLSNNDFIMAAKIDRMIEPGKKSQSI